MAKKKKPKTIRIILPDFNPDLSKWNWNILIFATFFTLIAFIILTRTVKSWSFTSIIIAIFFIVMALQIIGSRWRRS